MKRNSFWNSAIPLRWTN